MMTSTVDEKLMTGDELLELQSRTGKMFDLINGKPIEVMPAGIEHGLIAMNLGAAIYAFVKSRNLGYVLAAETGVYLTRNPDTVRGADVTFIQHSKMPYPMVKGFGEIIPDLVVEVVSPNDTPKEVREKTAQWLAAGVELVWLIYPEDKRAEVHTPNAAPELIEESGSLDGKNVLPDFALKLTEIF